MKTKTFMTAIMSLSALLALPSMAGAGIGVEINVPAPVVAVPAPVVVTPAPVVTVGIPDSYVWDGTEYVGVVGSDYFYLGPGDVWLAMDAPRLARFHDWEHGHPDWHSHAIHNDKYRNSDRHAEPQRDNHEVRDAGHDQHVDQHMDEHSRDVGHDHDGH